MVDMWRHGMHVQTVDGSQQATVVLEQEHSVRLRVQCAQCTPTQQQQQQQQQHLIQLVTEQCTTMLNAMYSRMEEKPFHEFVSCPHCLNRKGSQTDVVRISKERCAQLVVANSQTFLCGAESVDVSELRVDVALGELPIFVEAAVCIEPAPFAAGSFGLVSRARMRAGEVAVVVKELNPGKARQFLSKKDPASHSPADSPDSSSFNPAGDAL
jgi:hypothetical protein